MDIILDLERFREIVIKLSSNIFFPNFAGMSHEIKNSRLEPWSKPIYFIFWMN